MAFAEGRTFLAGEGRRTSYQAGFTERMWSSTLNCPDRLLIADDLNTVLCSREHSGAIPSSCVVESGWRIFNIPGGPALDLDPKMAPFKDVVTTKPRDQDLADRLGLPSFVKTSGSTGCMCSFHWVANVRTPRVAFAELLSEVIVAENREIARQLCVPSRARPA